MSNLETNTYPCLISNEIVGDDLFEGKSHESIAISISNALKSNTKKINVIGIDGGWGSGKSNLVRLVGNKLKDSSTVENSIKYKFFTYDAWGHQDDLQRRSILEELIDDLAPEEDTEKILINKNKWRDKLEHLLARKKVTNSDIVPKLGVGFIVSFIVAVLTLIFYKLAEILPNECHITAFVLSALPALVGATSIYRYSKFNILNRGKNVDKKETKKWSYFINIFEHCSRCSIIWGIILTILSIASVVIVREKCSLLLELNLLDIVISCMCLCAIVLSFVSIRKCKRIDRRNENKVSIKAVLQESFLIYQDKIKSETTFENISEREPTSRDFKRWMKDIDDDLGNNVTLIIVFDNLDRLPKKKVQELWATIHTFFADVQYEHIKVIVPFDRNHIISAFKDEDTNGDKCNICYGNDYIDKTFNVVYRVSPPTMSNWKKYFNDKWHEAFDRAEADKDVLHIFDVFSDRLTPRKIIAFINEFVTITQLEFAQNIPEKYIALFILGKEIIYKDPEIEILVPTYLPESIKYIYDKDEELPKYISALYYQMSADSAIDLVLSTKIAQALDNMDVEYIRNIEGSEKFIYVLDKAIDKISNIPNVVNTLFGIDSCETRIWDCIYKNQINKPEFEKIGELQEYQSNLLSKISKKEEYLKHIIELQSRDRAKFNVVQYSLDINHLKEIVIDINIESYMPEIEIDAETFRHYVQNVGEDWQYYKVKCKKEEFERHMADFSIEHLSNFTAYKFLKDHFDLGAYVAHVKGLINENISDVTLLEVLYKRLKEAEKPVGNILNAAELNTNISKVGTDSEFKIDLICMCIAKIKEMENIGYVSSYDDYLQDDSSEFVDTVCKQIEYYVDYGDLLVEIDTYAKYPLCIALAKKMMEQNNEDLRLSIIAVIKNYEAIIEHLKVEPKVLLQRLDASCKYAVENLEPVYIPSVSLIFFRDVVENNIDNDLTKHYKAKAIEYLNGLEMEDWKIAISENNINFELHKILLPNIPQNLVDAFKSTLLDFTKDSNIQINDKCISYVFEEIKSQNKGLVTIFKDIRDEFIKNVTIDIKRFIYFAGWFFEYGKLEESSESLRCIFTDSIVSNKDCLELIVKYQTKMTDVVNKANADDSNVFKERIKSMLEGNNYFDLEGFEEFAKSIGVERNIEERAAGEEAEEMSNIQIEQ